MNRKSYSLKKPSNRARMKAARAAVIYAQQLEQMLQVGANNSLGLQATICALLAQKGGEITISPGTIQQLTENPMHFVIAQGPGPNEVTLRLIPDSPEGDADAADNDDNDDDGSGAEAPPQGEVADQAQGVCGPADTVQGAGSGDGSSEG